MAKLPSCCGFRKVKAGMAWDDYIKYVRRLSAKTGRGLQPNEEQRAELQRLKTRAAEERKTFRTHCDDETLVHK